MLLAKNRNRLMNICRRGKKTRDKKERFGGLSRHVTFEQAALVTQVHRCTVIFKFF
jgi:hypothetical protein